MKKSALIIIGTVILTAFTFCFGGIAMADNYGYNNNKNTTFGTAASTSEKESGTADSSSSGAPAWVNELYSTPSPAPTTAPTADPNATPEPTLDPNSTPEPTAKPTETPAPSAVPSEIKAGTPEAETVKVPILLYHHISDEFDMTNAISIISPRDFRLHMTAIKTQYTPISLRDYVEFVNCTDGSEVIPQNPIIVTFDDGYLSNYEVAYPILKELNIPATIFVVTDTVGEIAGEGKVNYSHFTWEQAKEMYNSGLIDIQSHTNDHVMLGNLDSDTVSYELRKSKYLIEKNVGNTCDMIAYPYGSYSASNIESAKKAGYTAQCLVGDDTSDIDYEVNIPRDGVMNMTRITVSGTMGNVNIIELVRKAAANKIIE